MDSASKWEELMEEQAGRQRIVEQNGNSGLHYDEDKENPGHQYELNFPVEEPMIYFKRPNSYVLNPYRDLSLEDVRDILISLKLKILEDFIDPEAQKLIDKTIFIREEEVE
tara:strand:+ start:5093 stop:5425 length:333 start_codon:yes stop_codon:yes gene_type:complete